MELITWLKIQWDKFHSAPGIMELEKGRFYVIRENGEKLHNMYYHHAKKYVDMTWGKVFHKNSGKLVYQNVQSYLTD